MMLLKLGLSRWCSGKESACQGRRHEPSSIPGLGRSPGVGNGNPFQYSCLEKSMNRGAWWTAVHGIAKGWTWLSNCACTLIFHHRLILAPHSMQDPHSLSRDRTWSPNHWIAREVPVINQFCMQLDIISVEPRCVHSFMFGLLCSTLCLCTSPILFSVSTLFFSLLHSYTRELCIHFLLIDIWILLSFWLT